MDRRRFSTGLWVASAALLAAASGSRTLAAAPNGVDVEAILNDPAAPVSGNPDGDVTIVAFLDYNCPFCKRAEPGLQRLVSDDGKIRLVAKDWPILAQSSVYAARLALAAKYQGKYPAAHAALMAMRGQGLESAMRAAVGSSGVDMTRLDRDLAANDSQIMALIRRNAAQAKALGLQGTPVYLIGPYLVAAALTYDEFSDVVAKFRARSGK